MILISNFNHLAKSRFTGAIIAGLVCLLLLGSQLAELTSAHEDCEDAICLCVSSPSDSDLDPIDDGYFSAVVVSDRKVVPQLLDRARVGGKGPAPDNNRQIPTEAV